MENIISIYDMDDNMCICMYKKNVFLQDNIICILGVYDIYWYVMI